MYHFRTVAMRDLNTILQIENKGFSSEAASKEALINRINVMKSLAMSMVLLLIKLLSLMIYLMKLQRTLPMAAISLF